MRTHRNAPFLGAWTDLARIRDIVRADRLTAARVEPVAAGQLRAALLDLRFGGDDGVCVTSVLIDLAAQSSRLRDPLIWPAWAAEAIDDERAAAIAARVLPWLDEAAFGEGVHTERFVVFDDTVRPLFERARSLGFLGAAPLSEIGSRIAAAGYAARFASGKHLVVAGGDDALAEAGLLGALCATLAVPGTSADGRETAAAWFGRPFPLELARGIGAGCIFGDAASYEGERDRRCFVIEPHSAGEVAVGPVTALDELFLFHEPHAQSAYLRVEAAPAKARGAALFSAPVAVGGSAGRLLFVLSAENYVAGGEESRQAQLLAALLQAEGFTVEMTVDAEHADLAGIDLVHVHGSLDAQEASRLVQRAKSAGVPTVVTPAFEDVAAEAYWGIFAMRSCYDNALDDVEFERLLPALAERNIIVNGVRAADRFDYRGRDAARRTLLRAADAVIAASDAESEAIVAFSERKRAPVVTGTFAYDAGAHARIEHLVPDADFIFAHAEIADRSNLGLLLRAARELDLPLVVAGRVVDRRVYRELLRAATPTTAILPSCDEAQLEALYARASVFADVAWIGGGEARMRRAALCGAGIVVAAHRPLDAALLEHAKTADAASIVSLRKALSDAWFESRERPSIVASIGQDILSRWAPESVRQAIVEVYSEVAGRTREERKASCVES